MTNPISRNPIPTLDELPGNVRDCILEVQENSQFHSQHYSGIGAPVHEFRAFVAYHDALMGKKSGLSKAEREMIVVATSNANQCQYCVVAHGALLRIRAKNPPLIADQVAINYRKADLMPRQTAMLDFALKVSQAAYAVNDADFETLRGYGFTDADIWDIGAVAAFFAMSNRLANMTRLRPNDEFYLLGRIPKQR